MEDCLIILEKQISNLIDDYIGLTECCNNMLEFSEYLASNECGIHNESLAKNLNFKLCELYNIMVTIKNKINTI